jgi:hypothetical protein
MNNTESNADPTLYDFAVQWLKDKGCKFIDHGGWEAKESTDAIHKEHFEGYPQIVLGQGNISNSVSITTRLWVRDAYNIESRSENIAVCYTQVEVIAALTALHEILCQINEMLSRISDRD